jgi:hypothetical protein
MPFRVESSKNQLRPQAETVLIVPHAFILKSNFMVFILCLCASVPLCLNVMLLEGSDN